MTARSSGPDAGGGSICHIVVVALAAVGLALGVCVPTWALDAESARYYENALARFEKGDVAGSVIQLKNALQKDPGMLAAHVLLGRALLANGDAAAAEASFDQALKLGVDRSEVILLLARALAAQGKNDVVLARITPDGLPRPLQVDVMIMRGNAQAAKGSISAATRTYDEARALDPKSVSVRLAQAKLLVRTGDTGRASTLVEEALRLSPDASAGWNLRGSLLHLKGDLKGALADYAKAIALNPDDVDARVAEIGILIDLGRTEDAERALADLQRLSPQEPRAAYLRAVLAGRRNDSEAVRTSLADVVALLDGAPKNVVSQYSELLLLGGLSHYGLGNKEKAKEYLAIYLQQSPGHPGASKLLASIQIDAGETARAISLLEPLQKSAPNDPDVLSLLAAAYMADRRYGLATTALEQAVRISGGAPNVRADLGVSLVGSGQTELGLAQLEQAFTKDPGQARSGIALATLYLRRDQPRKAAAVIDAVVRRDPSNLAVINLQGIAHVAAGDRPGGRAAYERVLALDAKYHAAAMNLARLDTAEGKPDAARARLAAVLKADTRNGDAMFEMALLEEQAGNSAETIRWLERAMTNPRKVAQAGAYLTDFLVRQRDLDRAMAVSKQVVARAPKDLPALLARSRAQLAAGEGGSARQTLREVSSLVGFDAAGNITLARLQLAAKDRDGAVYSLDRALKAQPDYLPALVMMAEADINGGNFAGAEQLIRRINERHPDQSVGVRLTGDIAAARGQAAVALAHYRSALAKDNSSDAALRVYRALANAGDASKGLAFLEQWSKEHPADASAKRALADGYLSAGNLAAARANYEHLLQRRPDDPAVLNNLALVALRQGDNSALGYAERAVSLAPRQAVAIDTLGWVLVQQGQLERGIGVLRDARLRDRANPEIRYHLAFALAQSGRQAEARTELKEILKDAAAFDGADAARQLQRQLGP